MVLTDLITTLDGIMSISFWAYVETALAFWGAVGIIAAIIRYIHSIRSIEWREDVVITEHCYPEYDVVDAVYSITMHGESDAVEENIPITTFTAKGTVISKLKLIELDNNGRSIRVVEVFKKISPDQAVCFRIMKQECCAYYKLRWYSTYGDVGEYYFLENRRNGINDVGGLRYRKTIFSIIRRFIGLP